MLTFFRFSLSQVRHLWYTHSVQIFLENHPARFDICWNCCPPPVPWRRSAPQSQNGADAVYLGAGGFNARMAARNFSLDDLREAVIYSHVRGVRVHLTLNTLVTDRQMPEAAELIRNAALLGVDAFIVQDLGLAGLCRQIAPDVEVHASTQMSLHSLRACAPRRNWAAPAPCWPGELPADQITRICRSSPIEIEVFAATARSACAIPASATFPR